MNKKSRMITLVAGIFTCSAFPIVGHYVQLPDLLSGFIVGAGIGLMILSFIKEKPNTAS